MHQNIPNNTLLVISDTSVYKSERSSFAFEPVVRELNALSVLFDRIIWLGCKDEQQQLKGVAINNDKVKLVVLPSVRHKHLNSLFVLIAYPLMIFKILYYLLQATHIHTRGPSHPALIGICFSLLDRKRIYWHKYAGDWVKKNIPVTYAIQRALLRTSDKKNIHITVNGTWQNKHTNVLAFENPCLYDAEIDASNAIASAKEFSKPLSLLYVGKLTENKGLIELCTAVVNSDFSGKIKELIILGDGPISVKLQEICTNAQINVEFKGFLSREALKQYYSTSHILILPSKSEGFPKVVAEAAAYGCIPVVSAISAIPQYINRDNGILLQDITSDGIRESLQNILLKNPSELKSLSSNATTLASLFTYERFVSRLQKEVFEK